MPTAPRYQPFNRRLLLFYVVVGLCGLVLAGGLFYRQIVLSSFYRAAEERQNFRRILLPGPRGNIYDREGRLLVGNRALFSAVVYLNELRPEFRREYIELVRAARERNQIINTSEISTRARRNVVQRYLNRVNEVLGTDHQVDTRKIERHFAQNLLLPFPLVTDLTEEQYARLIEQVAVDSPLQVITDSARYYPHGEAACHVLGFVSSSYDLPTDNLPGEDLLTFRFEGKIGRAGLERSFNDHLQGITGGEIWSVDPSGFQYERVSYSPPIKGKDLVTSLDIDLQLAAERALTTKTGAVVALDIATGEVLALASRPGYDLNELSPVLSHATHARISESGAWLNRATQGLYPPGSTFKIVTAIAALEAGVVDAETEVYCPGHYMVGRRRFHCHNRSGHGYESLIAAIRDSCNVFFYDRALQIGVQRLAATARSFGLDTPTGIELLEETRSMLVPDPAWKKQRLLENWFDGDTANLSIGQGFLLVTPLQMAAFVASVARGEEITRPTLLAAGENAIDGEQRAVEEVRPIPLTDAQLGLIYAGMKEAGHTGTARLAGSPTMPVSGKTGTAQVRKEGRPTTLAWFVGYAPADDPRIAVAVMVEGVPEQETNYGGGSTAAPIAKEVFRRYFEKHAL